VSLRGRGEIKLARIRSSNNERALSLWNTNTERVADALSGQHDPNHQGMRALASNAARYNW
jgi:hypothetical protein